MKNNIKIRKFVCEYCDELFVGKDSLDIHINSEHINKNPCIYTDEFLIFLNCDICKKRYTKADIHKCQCKFCGKYFNPEELKDHIHSFHEG